VRPIAGGDPASVCGGIAACGWLLKKFRTLANVMAGCCHSAGVRQNGERRCRWMFRTMPARTACRRCWGATVRSRGGRDGAECRPWRATDAARGMAFGNGGLRIDGALPVLGTGCVGGEAGRAVIRAHIGRCGLQGRGVVAGRGKRWNHAQAACGGVG
jgi:hypothetical protein